MHFKGLIFFLDFRYTFRKLGVGSDQSVKNVTLFFLMKASLSMYISKCLIDSDCYEDEDITLIHLDTKSICQFWIYQNIFKIA